MRLSPRSLGSSSLRCHEQGIDQHISDGVNKLKTVKTKEAKVFSKSEAELVDVMDTFQHAISISEKEIAKNLAFLQPSRLAHSQLLLLFFFVHLWWRLEFVC